MRLLICLLLFQFVLSTYVEAAERCWGRGNRRVCFGEEGATKGKSKGKGHSNGKGKSHPVIIEPTTPRPRTNDETLLPVRTVQQLKTSCIKTDCRRQKIETIVQKHKTRDVLKVQFKDSQNADAEVNEMLELTQSAKKSIFRARGIGDFVEPSDNGLWQEDITLTKAQANYIKNHVEVIIPTEPLGSRKRRSAYFLEHFPAAKWPTTIYWASRTRDIVSGSSEHNLIKQAMEDISSKTCLRFIETSEGHSGSHMFFLKANIPKICGLSPIGRDNDHANVIILNPELCELKVGIIAHEILHSLGLQHQQSRVDRDKFIDVKWENINPQDYDYFEKADFNVFTTYGVSYDYYSVMHFSAQAGAISGNSIEAKKAPIEHFMKVMGNHEGGISSKDAETLRRMYCQPDCRDESSYCGYWQSEGYCEDEKGFFEYMVDNCKKSCQYC